jgi:hypothetical protein
MGINFHRYFINQIHSKDLSQYQYYYQYYYQYQYQYQYQYYYQYQYKYQYKYQYQYHNPTSRNQSTSDLNLGKIYRGTQ